MSRAWKKPNYNLPGWDYLRSGWLEKPKKKKKPKGKWWRKRH